MSLLSDQDIQAAIAAGDLTFDPPLVPGPAPLGFSHRDSSIQASSVDLHVGGILLPGTKDGDLGSFQHPETRHVLKEGETAVVLTRESISLSRKIAAFGFPPSKISFRGLLMTNPGHVDPGYQGRLRFAVINMGSESFELHPGMSIVSLLVFRLGDTAVAADYRDRRGVPTTPQGEPISEEALGQLSRDFVSVEKRAKKCAEEATRVAGIRISVFTPIVSLIGVALTVIAGAYFTKGLEKAVDVVDKRLSYIEKARDLDELKKQIDQIKEDIKRLKP